MLPVAGCGARRVALDIHVVAPRGFGKVGAEHRGTVGADESAEAGRERRHGIAAGRLELHTENIDLRPFVLDVASEIESLVSEKGLSLSLVMGAALPRIRTDPTHLRQILVNLLGNAVKYTNEGGIIIRTRFVDSLPNSGSASVDRSSYPTNPWIGIQVIDTGIGIDPADQSRIFEEFEQINAGPRGNSAKRGTGLGLAISRRLAALIGGMVELDSELGKGSTFTLWLPVDPDDLPVASK